MSDPLLNGDRDELGAYVRDMANEIGLRDWTIVMKDGDPEDTKAGADIDKMFGQKLAFIRFRGSWPEMPPSDLRWLVAHELVHLHLWEMCCLWEELSQYIPRPVVDTLNSIHLAALEHATDGIAREWAEKLPLPIKADELEEAA